jgi:superfamily II DNA or RNA helicase
LIAYNIKTHKTIEPLPHQQRILQELKIFDKALIHIPSGAGKTHTAAFDVLNKKPKTFLYIVHRNEILYQTVSIFKQVCKDFMNDENVGIINQEVKDFTKPYLFTTIQTLSRPKNFEKLDWLIQYIVIDEFHHSAAASYQRILDYFNPQYLYGLTATPDRSDLLNIKNRIDNNIVGNIDLFTGIKEKILVPFYYLGEYDNINYDNIEWNGYYYRQNDLDKTLLIDKRDKMIIQKYKDRIQPENRLTIGFCNSVKHVRRMTDKFNIAGIKAVGITYRESIEERKQILEDFRKRKYNILFARDILNEGIDFPECEALMLLRPTLSKIVFFQQLGRGLRVREGKKNVLILDFIGNYHNAFKIREYLRDFTQYVLKQNEMGKNTNKKPEYNYNIPIVEFDERVIDIMNLQHRYYLPSKEEIIQDYKLLTDLVGYPPRMEEMSYNSTNKLIKDNSKFSPYQYRSVFGSVKNFYEEMGLEQYYRKKISYCDDKDELVRNYKTVLNSPDIKNRKKNKYLTQKDLDNHPLSKYYTTAYNKTFGGLFEFRQYINEENHRLVKNYDLEWVLDAYKRLAKKLDRNWLTETDWRKEYDRKGYYSILRKHGGLNHIRKLLNITEYIRRCEMCNKEIKITPNAVKKGKDKQEEKRKIIGSRLVTIRFCSPTCQSKHYNNTKYRISRRQKSLKIILEKFSHCQNCNKKIEYPFLNADINSPNIKFYRSRFCSHSCRQKAQYKKRKEQKLYNNNG